MKKIIIVNEKDEIIWYKHRWTLNHSKDLFRVSALWIKNSKWDILLAQRSFKKAHNPWKWWPAVEWTNEEWETYDSNIIKRSYEEIWIEYNSPVPFKKLISWNYPHYHQWFLMVVDKEIYEFKLQKDEVEQIKWFSKEELLKELETNPDNYLVSIKDDYLLEV